jgi:RNA-directed DNA polymerase
MSHNLDKNAGRESDGRVLPTKHPNKGGSSTPAESMEERRPTKENTGQTAASQIQSWENALAGLHRVREAAKREKRLRFTALLHHVSVAVLSNSFYSLKRGAAPGVDGLTWQEYETDLDKRLEGLHRRVHRGAYRALPSKRAYILKQDGRQRPLGIAALEDKIVQHAVGTVLDQIYEEDFLGFSYGFRPGRSAHDALDALSVGSRCLQMFTYTMPSTFGYSTGGRIEPRVRLLWFGMRTIWCWGFSIERKRNVSYRIGGNDCRSLSWNYIRTRPA